MATLIYDLLILAVLALFVWRGWRKGLILSLCGLVVIVLSLVGAGFIADTAAPPVAKAIQPKLVEVIDESVTSYLDAHFDSTASIDTPDNAKVNMWDGMREMGGIYAWCADSVENAVTGVGSHWNVSEMLYAAANQVATQIAHRVLFSVSFVVLLVLLTLLLRALDLVAKLPGLQFCNGLGGGAIGLVKGILVLFVAVCVLQITSGQLFAPETVNETHLFKLFVEHNPILSLFRSTAA